MSLYSTVCMFSNS